MAIEYEQIALFALIGGVLVALLWGKYRYDLVAFGALILGVLLGVVPADTAFVGFGHDATIIIALVLVVTAGLIRSGAVDIVARVAVDRTRSLSAHIAILGGIGAILSGFINNVAALALLMPIDIQAASKAGRPSSVSLMPLAFLTILGGMLTMIGTPPNIIIASYRQQVTGEGFAMFDFTPVGAACALAGLAFIALGGWRLIPQHKDNQAKPEDDGSALYTAELVVNEKSKTIGERVASLDDEADEHDCTIVGLVRDGKRMAGRARRAKIKKGDLLVVHGSPDALNALSGALGLSLQGHSGKEAELTSELTIVEAVISANSRIVGRTANEIQMMRAYGLSLLGISRSGKAIAKRVRRTPLQVGDVLLLMGNEETIDAALMRMDCLPMASSVPVIRHEMAWLAIGLFGAAVAAGAFGITPLTVGLGAVAVLYVLFGILPVREIYTSIQWPVVVLLGSLLPIGMALETSGGTDIIAGGLAQLAQHLPVWMVLTCVLVFTMTLSDALNNAATAVIAAPIAYGLALMLDVNPDAFLMAVAIGASCAFLTPIGHNNSALIMGPGGYRFSDYWRMGLPLEVIIVVVGVPAIMMFWPL